MWPVLSGASGFILSPMGCAATGRNGISVYEEYDLSSEIPISKADDLEVSGLLVKAPATKLYL